MWIHHNLFHCLCAFRYFAAISFLVLFLSLLSIYIGVLEPACASSQSQLFPFVPILCSLVSDCSLKSHNENIYTMEINKCYKLGLLFLVLFIVPRRVVVKHIIAPVGRYSREIPEPSLCIYSSLVITDRQVSQVIVPISTPTGNQQSKRITITLYLHQHLIISVFLILAILLKISVSF